MSAIKDTVKIPVVDAFVYQDENRKVECVHFKGDNYGLRLTNFEGEVTKIGLSKIAVEQIATGFAHILAAKRGKIKEQKFILEPKAEMVWREVQQ